VTAGGKHVAGAIAGEIFEVKRVTDWKDKLTAVPGANYLIDEPLSRHTSFRIGGPADLLATPESKESISGLFRAAGEAGVPVTVLGGGTNVLVLEGGVRGLVLKLGEAFIRVSEAPGGLCAGAATPLARLLAEARKRCLSGLEFAAGIPGTVGGGLWVNCGALGQAIGSRFVSGVGVSLDGDEVEVDKSDVTFEYRRASFARPMVLTEATFELEPGDPVGMDKAMHDALEKRRSQPLDLPSAGCVFKNPAGDPAARLIDSASLKGLRVGGAMVSNRHANYIVNVSDATAADVLDLIAEIKKRVMENSSVSLEMEVRVIGEKA
jgi:UDP-N-acetylmuramate dehydrogenase